VGATERVHFLACLLLLSVFPFYNAPVTRENPVRFCNPAIQRSAKLLISAHRVDLKT
jgi:hypothetical protein